MERRTIQTLVGEVPVWSDFDGHDTRRPLVVAIRGALPGPHDLEWLAPAGADIAFLHMPGFYSPVLVNNSIGVTIHAFDRLITATFAQRRVVLLGASTGALPAMGLRSPQIVGRVLVEPFLSTAKLEALAEYLRRLIPQEDREDLWSWFREVLGISPTGLEARDYRHLAVGGLPLRVVVGDALQMPPHPMGSALPTLTDEADRELLRSLGARITIASGGHGITNSDRDAISRALDAMLHEVGGG